MEALERTVQDTPGDLNALLRLLNILDSYIPGRRGLGVYSECQRALSEYVDEKINTDDLLDPVKISDYYKELQNFIDLRCNPPPLSLRQLFYGEVLTVNGEYGLCGLRMALFEKTDVISRLCHDCYKVQILPLDLERLVQIHFILQRLDLPRSNAGKSMVEVREKVPFPYKAYIYCESEDEAKVCLEKFREALAAAGISRVRSGISHGCSEYGLKYPDFRYSADGSHRSFARPAHWEQTESDFWSANRGKAKPTRRSRKEVFSIRDILVFRSWIDYAEIIGDHSAKMFRDRPSLNKPEPWAEHVRKQAQRRNAQMEELRRSFLPGVASSK